MSIFTRRKPAHAPTAESRARVLRDAEVLTRNLMQSAHHAHQWTAESVLHDDAHRDVPTYGRRIQRGAVAE